MPFGDGHVRLGDHDRLYEKHIRWDSGWNMSRFIERLNGLVFFWPGTQGGPRHAGLDHKRRYDNEGQPMVVLRAPLGDLIATNGRPLLSSCNSGAPRSNPRSGKQPRGADTFRSIDSFGVYRRSRGSGF